MENQQVVVMEFGEPTVMNVIGINHDTREVQVQNPGHYGSYWTSFDKCMTQADIEWHFISKAAAEVRRLEMKKIRLENQKAINTCR